MSGKQPSRARGSYAPLICLNCRARKIKCHLPRIESVQPSNNPQPQTNACQRCQYLELDCVVQKTVLGRPSSKRNRAQASLTEDSSTSRSRSLIEAESDEPPSDETGIENYLLSEVSEKYLGGVMSHDQPARPPKNSNEAFEALMSAPYLLSALLSHDRRFAASVPVTLPRGMVSLTKLITAGLAALLDENLVWLRFFVPGAPTLVALRQSILVHQEGELKIVNSLLFSLLCLISLDAPSSRLRNDQQLYHSLQTAAFQYGQSFLFAPPARSETILVLAILTQYRPTALIAHQSVATKAVKLELYMSLAIRVAEKVESKDYGALLLNHLRHGDGQGNIDIDQVIIDSLQWCHILVHDALLSTFVAKPVSTMHRLEKRLEAIIQVIPEVLNSYPQRVKVIYLFHRIRTFFADMQYGRQAKQNWRDLDQLAHIIGLHDEACNKHQEEIHNLIIGSQIEFDASEEAAIAISLVEGDMLRARTRVTGMAMFYTMMSQLKPEDDKDDIGPNEAMQVSDQIIKSLKEFRIGRAAEVTAFLARFGDERDVRLQAILQSFINASRGLKLDGVSFLPPPGMAALEILTYCREIVENNAARMKGWGGLHPEVDNHLDLFEGCARQLEIMSTPDDGTPDQAFGRGCLYAACAKLIHGLHSIVKGWKAKATANEEASQMSWAFTDTSSSTGSFDPLQDLDFDELFGQWGNWPHADTMDFSQIVLD